MNKEQLKAEVFDLLQTQETKRTFDFVRSFVAKAGTAGMATIPINSAGEFRQLGYNIRFSENSTKTHTEGGETIIEHTSFCRLKFRAQSANNSQSNDFIPIQLIATPGSDKNPRYGTRPFAVVYQKSDSLVIEYDNREPQYKISGYTYDVKDETIDIVFNGHLYTF